MIPKIDSEIGISVYTTKFPGCGGIIKKQNDDFVVSEVKLKRHILGFAQILVMPYTN